MRFARLVRRSSNYNIFCDVNIINHATRYRFISTLITMDKTRTDNSRRASSILSSKPCEQPYHKTVKIESMSISSTVPQLVTTATNDRTYSTMVTSSFSSDPSANTIQSQLPYAASSYTALGVTPTTSTRHQSKDSGSMDDEYGTMEASGKIYTHPTPYQLESFGMFGHYTTTTSSGTSGKIQRGVLNPAFLNYNTYGTLNAARDNVIVICHALTGNASLEAWWGGLLGAGKAFDTDQYFIVCANILGSCYGSCGPSSQRPGFDDDSEAEIAAPSIPRDKSNRPIYGIDFPDVSVRDTVRLQLLMLKNELNIKSIKCVIGGSFGGMQVMEYCAMAGATRPIGEVRASTGGGDVMMVQHDMGGVPYGLGEFVTKRNGRIEPYVRSAVPIACGAAHTAWQIAISETQRQAIYADPKWNNGHVDANDPPNLGLSVARQIGMVSYRTPLGYQKKFGRALTDESGPSYGRHAPWQVKSYLEYQGKKFLDRFDPVTYVKLTEQMDSHDISRGRGSMEQVLSHIEIPVCVLGIDSDVLYPLHEQEELARLMPNAELKIIHSGAGHDGFLLEQDQVAAHIKSFLYSHE